MRLPLVPALSTKDGVSNKNARLTNTLKETTATSEFAVVRPGLALNAEATGVGKGLVVFNNELVSVYGTTLGVGAGGIGATTLNPDETSAGVYLSNGDLTLTPRLGYLDNTKSITYHATGKWYAEISFVNLAIGYVGIATSATSFDFGNYCGIDPTSYGWGADSGLIYNDDTSAGFGDIWAGATAIVSVLFDADTGELFFWINGVDGNVVVPGDPAFIVPADSYALMISISGETGTETGTANLGNAAFSYTPPVGYSAWGGGTTGITSLATVSGDHFDFAQSPL